MHGKTLTIVCSYFLVLVCAVYADVQNKDRGLNRINSDGILENGSNSDSDGCKSIADCNYLGECRNISGKNMCWCFEGISGEKCTVVKECQRNPNMCSDDPEAECSLSNNAYSGIRKAICKCKEGKRFDNATKKCVPQKSCSNDEECKNYGTCEKDGESQSEVKYCKCHYGTSGDFCERIEECTNSPKLCGEGDNVVCRFNDRLERAYCQCKDPNHRFDWKEKKCVARIECRTNNECQPFGVCADQCQSSEPCLDYDLKEDKKSCHCVEGTSGNNCEVVDDCINNVTKCGDNAICKYSYYHGITAQTICECKNSSQQFDQVQKVCRECDCGPKGTCSFHNGEKVCTCEPDALNLGGRCEDPNPEECVSVADCNYLGQCRKIRGKNVCVCYEGLSGKNCSVIEECRRNPNMCGDDPEAECSLHKNSYSGVRKAICECSEGKRFDIPTKKCVPQKPCENAKQCKHSGICGDEFNESKSQVKYCKCHYGTSGDFCERVEECINNPKLCGEGDDVECRFNDYLERAYCQCKDPNHRFDWKEKKCVARTGCKSNDECQPLGLCADKCQKWEPCLDYEKKEDKKSCHCVEGTSGPKCEVIDDCINGITKCGDNAICMYSFHDGILARAYCECLNSSQKFDQVEKQCKDCDCGPKGTCAFRNGIKMCNCKPDALDTGNSCEDCKCGEGSTGCIMKNGVKECLCKTGFKNLDGVCEAICNEEYKCENGGRCMNNKCVCLEGTGGIRCGKIPACDRGLCGFDKDVLCSYDKKIQKPYCSCKNPDSEFDSLFKECKACDCGKYSNGCKFEGEKTICSCMYGFAQGDYGECKPKCDLSHKCSNGGRCLNDICICQPGTGGDYCGKIYDCEDKLCGSDPSVLCQYDERKQKATCSCQDLDKIYDSFNKICKACKCGTTSSSQEYVEKCEFNSGKKVCHCIKGYSYNTYREQCSECSCGSNAIGCSFDDKGKKVCQCKPKYIQYDGICKECSCGENGVCTLADDYYSAKKVCTCASGYKEYKGICEKCDCGVNGECVFSKYEKKSTCKCDPGFAENPSAKKCQVCECGPSQKCSFSRYGQKICDCRSGYNDNNGYCVDIDECQFGKKCTEEGRTCVNTMGSYRCECKPGYKKQSNADKTCVKDDETQSANTSWKVGYALLSVGFIIIIAVLVYIIFRLKSHSRY